MTRTNLFIVLLATSLLAAPGCGNPDAASKAIDQTIDAATENVQNVAGDAANALDNAVEELDGAVQSAAQEAGKALDSAGRKESTAK
jgi:hypothetical protein